MTPNVSRAAAAAGVSLLALGALAALRLQTPFTSARVWAAYHAVSALIVSTTLLALGLLWSWDAPFVDGGDGGSANVANVAQRVLLALFALSVGAYLALPLVTRLLTAKTERDD